MAEPTPEKDQKRKRAVSAGKWGWSKFKGRDQLKKLAKNLIGNPALLSAIAAAVISTAAFAQTTTALDRANDALAATSAIPALRTTVREVEAQIPPLRQEVADLGALVAEVKGDTTINSEAISQAAGDVANIANTVNNQAVALSDAVSDAQAALDIGRASAVDAQHALADTASTAAKLADVAGHLDQVAGEVGTVAMQTQAAAAAANEAKTEASQASSTADGAVSQAQEAKSAAADAKAAADAAQATADAAVDAAATAQSTADDAQSAAEGAQSTAEAAQLSADDALAIAQQALALAQQAQGTADTALARGPQTTQFPNQTIVDNVGTFDDPPAGSITVEPGLYLFTFGGTYNQSFQVRLRTSNNTVLLTSGCMAAGTRTVAVPARFTTTTTIYLDHDSCGANVLTTFENPFIQYIKLP